MQPQQLSASVLLDFTHSNIPHCTSSLDGFLPMPHTWPRNLELSYRRRRAGEGCMTWPITCGTVYCHHTYGEVWREYKCKLASDAGTI